MSKPSKKKQNKDVVFFAFKIETGHNKNKLIYLVSFLLQKHMFSVKFNKKNKIVMQNPNL